LNLFNPLFCITFFEWKIFIIELLSTVVDDNNSILWIR